MATDTEMSEGEARKLLLASARHLTRTQMAYAMYDPGIDWRGCSKNRMVDEIIKSKRFNVAEQAFDFRMATNHVGVSGILPEDEEALRRRLTQARHALKITIEEAEKRRRISGQRLAGLDNVIADRQRKVRQLENLMAHCLGISESPHGGLSCMAVKKPGEPWGLHRGGLPPEDAIRLHAHLSTDGAFTVTLAGGLSGSSPLAVAQQLEDVQLDSGALWALSHLSAHRRKQEGLAAAAPPEVASAGGGK